MDISPDMLRGRLVELREFRPSDAAGLLKVYGDSHVTRLLSFDPYTEDRIASFLDRVAAARTVVDRTEYALAVADATTEALIGSARVGVEAHRAAQIGFAVAAHRWGSGVGTEVVTLLLELAFEHLDLHRVWAAHAPDNFASARVLEKHGFVPEGLIRHHVFAHGAWRDSATCSLLEHEWRERRAEMP